MQMHESQPWIQVSGISVLLDVVLDEDWQGILGFRLSDALQNWLLVNTIILNDVGFGG